jgi:hypothetical protein
MARFQYALRPAKHIERWMIVDACRRLDRCEPVRNYEYVGFGSFEFVDFELVHRELGIDRMVSIESQTSIHERCRFNLPFDSIEFIPARASACLPDLLDDVATRRLIWLDYTDPLSREVLQDVSTCLRKLVSGSMLIVSVNAHPPRKPENTCECVDGTEETTPRLNELGRQVGADRVPPDVEEDGLAKWGYADVQHRILTTAVPDALARRSARASWLQLFHLRYSDGAQMLTWGGLVVDEDDETRWKEAFSGLTQCRDEAQEPLMISVPVLTSKEAICLNRLLPAAGGLVATGISTTVGIPEADCMNYESLYQWYPPVPTPI